MKLDDNQKNIMEAMMLCGASREKALKSVQGYKKNIDFNCPYCNSGMKIVSLITGERVRYCEKDRVCLPL